MSTPDLPPVPPPAPVPAAGAPVPAKKSNTLVIVLCVILGIFLLLIASCVGTCLYVGKKAKNYAEESKKNPQISAIALVAAVTPGVEVVSKDLDAGVITLKNKKTGETVKLDSANFSQEKMEAMLEKLAQGSRNMSASSSSSSSSSESTASTDSPASSASSTAITSEQAAAQAEALKTFAADFPLYTSGSAKTVDATQQSFAGMSSSEYSFTTSDAPTKVAEYYAGKLAASGYSVMASQDGSDSNGPISTRIFQKDGGTSTYNLNADIENGKTRVTVSHVMLGKK